MTEKFDISSYDWKKIARPSQQEPSGDWKIWLILAGRGFGKTRTGAETIRSWVSQGKSKRIALISETERDVNDVMIEGVSGLLSVHPKEERPIYISSRKQLLWPSGAIAQMFTSTAYNQLRGPQFDSAWVDELAKFDEPQKTWDQLMFSLRLGENPRVIVTTTPQRIPILNKLINDKSCWVTRGSTYENQKNLSETFLKQIEKQYEGTTLGLQEIYGEILENYSCSHWTRSIIHYKKAPNKNMFYDDF